MEIKAEVRINHQSKIKRAGVQELALLGISLVVAFFLFRTVSYLTSPSSGAADSDQVMSLQELSDFNSADAFNSADNPLDYQPSKWLHGIPPQEPLSSQSSHEDIWRRLLLSRYLWKTLWADVRVILNGPEDYSGPPQAERHQLWLDQEHGGLHLSGTLDSNPDYIERINPTSLGPRPAGFLYSINDYARLGSQIPWFYLSSEMIFTPYMINFFFISDYDFPPNRLHYQVIDEGEWAGRQAVIVDVIDQNGRIQARQWLDSTTGIILRELFFGYGPDDGILLETNITRIEFDVEFPNGFIQDENHSIIEGGFVQDFNGNPEFPGEEPGINPNRTLSNRISLPMWLPPQDFDYARSHLSFASGLGTGESPGQSSTIHVYADSYYLGDIEIIDPFRTLCVRSSIGDRIAISQWSRSLTNNGEGVHIYNLKELDHVEYSIPDLYVRFLSFSPDDRYIAMSSLDEKGYRTRNLYIIDTESGERRHIPEIGNIWSLAWSPDGTKLASLRWPSFRNFTQSILRVYVYDLSSGKINTFLVNSNLPWGKTEVSVPLQDWNAKFSLTLGGLEPCVNPP